MSNGSGLQVGVEKRGNITILRPVGDIDMSCSPTLRAEIMTARQGKPDRLVVDLSEVHYMDSSGVATLVEAMKGMRQMGGTLVLCCMRERVSAIFEIARLSAVFRITADLEEALEG